METEQRIINALRDLGLPVFPNIYTGEELSYFTFSFDSIPESFAEGTAVGVREMLSVHLFLPNGQSPVRIKRRTVMGLIANGATYPSITNASDEECQHYIFECEVLQEQGDG